MTKDQALARIAVRQRSLVTLDDALSVGMTEGDVGYRSSTGRLIPVRKGVFRMPGSEPTWEQQVLAACLAAGPAAVASHATAAHLHGFAGFGRPARLDLTVPWPLRTRLAGVRARRVNELAPHDTTRTGGIPVTTVARTVVDVASLVDPLRLSSLVNDLMRRRVLDVAALVACADRVDDSRLRRRMKVIRALISAKSDGFHPGDSDPEVWMIETLVGAGLGRPVQQFRVKARGREYRMDAAYPEFKVAVEYEGEDGHARPGDLQRDRRRLNALRSVGWDVRFATKETTEQELVEDVRNALLRAGAPTARV